MHDFMAITMAMPNANQVRILLALRRGELCVRHIGEGFLRASPATFIRSPSKSWLKSA